MRFFKEQEKMNRINIMRLSLLILFAGSLVLGGLRGEALAEETAQHEQIALRIDGMTCPSCTKKVKKALMNVSGVKKADVTLKKETWWNPWSEAEGKAVVEFETGVVTVDRLIEIVEQSSNAMYTYTATVLSK